MKTILIILAIVVFGAPAYILFKRTVRVMAFILEMLGAKSLLKQFEIRSGQTTGLIFGEDVHIFSRSCSRFGLESVFARRQYCCQCGNCDRGLRPEVIEVVRRAKSLGATRVILRNARVESIEGLPISDVSKYEGKIDKHHKVVYGY